MKRPFILLLSLLPLWAAAQNSYTISGKLPAGKGQLKAYLYLMEKGVRKLDSTEIKNGIFSFTGSVADPQKAGLLIRHHGDEKIPVLKLKDFLEFYVEQGTIRIVTADSIRHAKITGSVLSRENQQLSAALMPYLPIVRRLTLEVMNSVKSNPASAKEAWLLAKADTLFTERKKMDRIQDEFIKTHPGSFVALDLFNDLKVRDGGFDPDTMQVAFSKFSAPLRSSALGRQIAQRIAKEDKRRTGTVVYDFTQPDVNGNPFTLSSLKGKYVLVDFWASWCSGCRMETPHIAKAYRLLKDKGLEVVSVSLDNNRTAWEAAMKKDGMPWINVSDLKGVKNDVAVFYGITMIPKNILIDPQGMIIAKDLRGEDLTEKLAALMK